jgi:hypothetical protein
VSVRHDLNESGYIVKYEYVPGRIGQDEFRELARTKVGDYPSRISMSQDEARIVVCNTMGKSVEVLSAVDLKKMGGFFTGKMEPLYAHELRAFGRNFEEEDLEAVLEAVEEEELFGRVRFLSS